MNEESVGKNINSIRKQKNITLQELARRSGLTKSYLSRIERSQKAPPYSTVNRVAIALEVEVAYLLSEKLDYSSDIRFSLTKNEQRQGGSDLGLFIWLRI